MNNVEVIYTPWANLKKSPSMDVGQVGFHNPRMVITFFLPPPPLRYPSPPKIWGSARWENGPTCQPRQHLIKTRTDRVVVVVFRACTVLHRCILFFYFLTR